MSASRCLKRLLHDDDGGLRASDGDQLPILAVAALEGDNISATWIAHDMKFSRAVLSWIVGKTLSRGGGNVGQQGWIAQAIWDDEGKSIFNIPKSQATWANQPLADNSLIWQRLAPKHLWARLTRTLSNSGVKQSRQALPGWAKSSEKRRRRTSFIEFSERTEVNPSS